MDALFLAAMISVDVTNYGWRYQDESSGRWFIALTVSTGCWSFLEAFLLPVDSLFARLLWLALEPIPAELSVFFTLLFALEIMDYEQWVSQQTATLLAMQPAFAIADVATSALGVYALLQESPSFATVGGITTTEIVPGPLFWVDMAYSYIVVGAALVVFGIHCLRSRQIYRRQALILLVATLISTIVGAVYLLIPFSSTNPIAISSVATLSLLAVGLSQHRILGISPITRSLVIERMADPALVVDRESRLAGGNPTARVLFDASHSSLGSPAADAFGPETVKALESDEGLQVVDNNSEARHFKVDWPAVTGGRDATRGHLHILHDIAERRARERWFRASTENASDLVFALGAGSSVIHLSDSAAQTLGTDKDPGEMWSLRRSLHPDGEGAAIEAFREMLEHPDEDVTVELRFHSSTRGWRVFGVRCRNLLDDPVADGVVINAQDVTDR